MKVQLYRLPPFKEFGMGWMLVDEHDNFKVFSDEGIPPLNGINLDEESSTTLYEFLASGEKPELLIPETTLEEAYNYMQMEMLLE